MFEGLQFTLDDFKPVETETIGGAWRRKNLKPDAVPSIFAHSVKLSESSKRRRERRREKQKQKEDEQKHGSQKEKLTEFSTPEIESAPTNFFSDDIGLQETEIGSIADITGKIKFP